MPTGMLTPLPDAPPPPPPGTPAERLSVLRSRPGGEWIELQVARPDDRPGRADFTRGDPESRYITVDVARLLHDPLSRALPGFDLFVPRLFEPGALGRLRGELLVFEKEVLAIGTLAVARGRWGEVSPLVDGLEGDVAWLDARATLVRSIETLAALADELRARGRGLWVLGG
jgi:hypothetical protein